VALDVSMDELLGHMESSPHGQAHAHAQSHVRSTTDHAPAASRPRELGDWMPSEGGPLHLPAHQSYSSQAHSVGREETRGEEPRAAVEAYRARSTTSLEPLLMREGELMSKLHDLLHSPMGPGIARIIDELLLMLPRTRNLS
jgi:hypothetical protein